MEILAGLSFWSGALLCLPAGFLLLEVVCGLWRLRPLASSATPHSAVILIPAHDEEAGIARTLQRLAEAGGSQLRVIVLADNCTDATAQIARAAGAEVFERADPARRGKPQALAWALQRLAADPPEVVVFLDADCWFSRGLPAQLAAQSLGAGRPVQCVNLVAGQGLAAFAFRLHNEARPRGLQALRAPVQLTGTGFAVPWPLLQQVPVPVGELAEDAAWGWSFCRAGLGVALASEIEIQSEQPKSRQEAAVQRRRWEHGLLAAQLRHLPRLARSALVPPRWPRIAHLLDVLIPPLALLVLLQLAALILGLASSGARAALPAAIGLATAGSAVLIGWLAYGRSQVSLRDLLLAPVYVLKKSGLYLTFLFKREIKWQRTGRGPAEPGN